MSAAGQRKHLYEQQHGECFFCKRVTVLPEDLLDRFRPENPVILKPKARSRLIEHLLKTNPIFQDHWMTDMATIEHMTPRSAGGSDTLDNLVMACAKCNQDRGKALNQQRQRASAGPLPPGPR